METRRRIEARLKAKREAELNAKKQLLQHRSPSPSKHEPTRILHVEGLTRPFTKDELKDLLCKDGAIMEEAFWIDKIRSHCIAVYDSKDIAMKTRQHLHGIKWPLTSPKYLSADFLTAGQVSHITDGQLVIQEEGEPDQSSELSGAATSPPAAEPSEPPVAMDTTEESVPVKPTMVLDELFRKTKATPSIYWLPLTEAQVLERVTKEKQEEEEREKKREERRKAWMAQRESEEKERGRRLQEERERRARDRVRHRSRSRSRDRRRR